MRKKSDPCAPSGFAILPILTAALQLAPPASAQDSLVNTGYGNYNTNQQSQFFNGKTYFVYNGIGSDRLDPMIASFNHRDGAVSSAKVGDAPGIMVNQTDDHGNPVMLVDSSGYIHVIFGGHGNHRGSQKYFRSTKPEDFTSFDAVNSIPDNNTYPNLLELPDSTLMFFYRGPDNHPDSWYLQTSATGGATWTSPLEVISGGKKRTDGKYYEKTYSDGWYGPDVMYEGKEGATHFVIAFHAHASDHKAEYHQLRRTSIFHFLRTASGAWQTMGGQSLSLPITREVMEANCTAFEAKDKVGPDVDSTYPQNLTVDESGNPYLLFKARDDDDPKFTGDLKMVYWTGSGWSSAKSVPTRAGGYLEVKGGNIDIYSDKHYRSSDHGSSWSNLKTIFTSGRSPYAVHKSHPDVRGIYINTSDPIDNQRVYLWGDSGFVTAGVGVGGSPVGAAPARPGK